MNPFDIVTSIVAGAVQTAARDPGVPELAPSNARAVTEAILDKVVDDPRLNELQTPVTPKPWYASVTLWGIVISAAFKALAVAMPGKVDPSWGDTVVHYLPLAVSFVGDAIATIGRLRAKQPIGAAPAGA